MPSHASLALANESMEEAMNLRTVVGAAAALGIFACGGAERPMGVPEAQTLRGDNAASAVVASAKGSGCFDLSSAGLAPGCVEFDAVRYADNSSAGQFRMRRPGSGGIVGFEARVICLVVDAANSHAWLGAVITKNFSTDPAAQTAIHQVGKDVWFRVVDYAGSEPIAADRTTVLGFEGSAGFITSIEYCDGRPWPALDARTFPFLSGNVVVSP
jgi:hypothetical protein